MFDDQVRIGRLQLARAREAGEHRHAPHAAEMGRLHIMHHVANEERLRRHQSMALENLGQHRALVRHPRVHEVEQLIQPAPLGLSGKMGGAHRAQQNRSQPLATAVLQERPRLGQLVHLGGAWRKGVVIPGLELQERDLRHAPLIETLVRKLELRAEPFRRQFRSPGPTEHLVGRLQHRREVVHERPGPVQNHGSNHGRHGKYLDSAKQSRGRPIRHESCANPRRPLPSWDRRPPRRRPAHLAGPDAGTPSSMNHILVLYDSRSGNTQKMAQLVVEGAQTVPDTEVRLRSVDEAKPEDVFWCHGLAVGSPTNLGLMSWKMKKFWDEVMCEHWMQVDGKIGCAFSSAGAWGGGMEIACQSILSLLVNFGFLVFGVTDYAGKGFTAHYGAVALREPREPVTQEGCRLLGRRLAEWTALFVHGRKDQHPDQKGLPRLGAN